jgi:hypothetical protein
MSWGAAERAVALQRLAFVLMKSQDFAAAEQPLRDCLALRLEAFGPEYRSTVDTENRLGECIAGLKRFEEAEAYLLRSYSCLTQLSNIPVSWYSNYCQRLISLYSDWGKPDEEAKWKVEWQNAVHREIASLPSGTVERAVALYRWEGRCYNTNAMVTQNLCCASAWRFASN